MFSYAEAAEAARQLRNLEAIRRGVESWFQQMQALKLLPSVIALKDGTAPERKALERAAVPDSLELT